MGSRGEEIVLESLRQGWAAFRRSALALVPFALLVAALLALTAMAQRLPLPAAPAPVAVVGGLLRLAARLAALLLALWGTTGLLRGAAAAVEGRRPGPGLLLRRDGRACRRLFLAALLLTGLMALSAVPVYALVAASVRFAPRSDPLTGLLVALLPLAPALVLLHQLPLGPLLTREPCAVPTALLRSHRTVARHRGAALVLAAVPLALLWLGAAHPLLQLGLVLPLAICLGTAAERELSRTAGC